MLVLKKRTKRTKIFILSSLVLLVFIAGVPINIDPFVRTKKEVNALHLSGEWTLGDITITGNWSSTISQDWCFYENGSYIIENVTCGSIFITNTTEAFQIRNCVFYSMSYSTNRGIVLRNASNGIIRDNINWNCTYGVQMIDGSNITISNNIFLDSSEYIYLIGASSVRVENNDIIVADYGWGIFMTDSNDIWIAGNHINGNARPCYGIYALVSDMIIYNNSFSDLSSGIEIITYNCTISENIISDCTNPIQALNSFIFSIINNDIKRAGDIGIEFLECGDGQISHNRLQNIRNEGIYLERTNFTTVFNNTIQSQLNCIKQVECEGNTIENNSCQIISSSIVLGYEMIVVMLGVSILIGVTIILKKRSSNKILY
ncbi:MAG: nitrous oxide reductase family maturation protein NosD [Promethearchaeota archaeon]